MENEKGKLSAGEEGKRLINVPMRLSSLCFFSIFMSKAGITSDDLVISWKS